MKKISILSLLTLSLGVFIFSSCCNKAEMPKADLKTESDSLAYAIGISNAQGMKQRLMGSGIDSAYFDSFVQGVLQAAFVTDSQKIAYNLGIQFGQGFDKEGFERFNKDLFNDDSLMYMNKDVFLAGLVEELLNKNVKIDATTAPEYLEKTIGKIRNDQAEKMYAPNRDAGIKFMVENAAKEGVTTLPCGVQYKVIKEGKGPKPTKTDHVKVNYKGTLIDGTEFDNSYTRSEPFPCYVGGGVIPGWTEVLSEMPVGSKWEVVIPQELAYGSQDRGIIKPFSVLVFEIELLEIEKPTPAPTQTLKVNSK